ncbi:hypothetical protein [Saccharothrix texasensis]|uniref:hypothetical protein n=1 Tax=Saccharothrix texasensis TaxID=103734 RepID=UPI000F4C5C9A|nr:hypothetical protein [Saccharothrix texasensis]
MLGRSCGGVEADEVAADPCPTTTVLWNSGMLGDSRNHLVQRLRVPIASSIGGSTDIAHENAMDDRGRLPAGLPAFRGNLDVGHFGTFERKNLT